MKIYAVEYYLAIKKKEILSFVTALMDLESIMLSQSEKDKYHFIHMWNIINEVETESWIQSI